MNERPQPSLPDTSRRQPGWQQPARTPKCAHLGLLFAGIGIGLHDVGHEWLCSCGQMFVVVTGDGGQTKRFEKRSRR